MENAEQAKIVLITKDREVQDFVALILIGEGHDVKAYNSPKEALEAIREQGADLIITHHLLPDIDSISLCLEIRRDPLLRYIPFLILVPGNETLVKTKAIYAGADDFIEVPVNSDELLPRVKATIWRSFRSHELNPLTGLPGIAMAIKEIGDRIKSGQTFCVAHADLYQLRKFNQKYGFARGDEIIKYVGKLINTTLSELGTNSDMLVHFSGDDFMLITTLDSIDDVCAQIIDNFQKNIGSFYDQEDTQQGYITLKDRKGAIVRFPLLRLHIGVTNNRDYAFTSPAQVQQIAEEIKNYAKTFEKSIYVKERRKSYPFY